ncbi:MAG: hypothetical protein EKK36_13765 [Bradyrhizobiaceae bacterium]|nr:MAG: hypothetical protein EKK36_13765 [Bradyrhizobiaceae bacterium]
MFVESCEDPIIGALLRPGHKANRAEEIMNYKVRCAFFGFDRHALPPTVHQHNSRGLSDDGAVFFAEI